MRGGYDKIKDMEPRILFSLVGPAYTAVPVSATGLHWFLPKGNCRGKNGICNFGWLFSVGLYVAGLFLAAGAFVEW